MTNMATNSTTARVYAYVELVGGKNVKYQILPTLYKNYRGEVYIVSFRSSCFRAYKPSWIIQYSKQFGDVGTAFVSVAEFMRLISVEGRQVQQVSKVEKVNPDKTIMQAPPS